MVDIVNREELLVKTGLERQTGLERSADSADSEIAQIRGAVFYPLSSDGQPCYAPYARNLAASEIVVQITQVLLQVFQAFALRHVVWELLQEAKPSCSSGQ